MAREIQTQQRHAPPSPAWPLDDTEESVLGTDFHQMTITNLRWGLNEAARVYAVPEQPIPWKALSQTMLLGCLRPDGSHYTTLPDVFVFPHPIDPTRPSVSLQADGSPLLIVEVLSEATYKADLDLSRGKGYSYAQAGVHEYMTIDPTGTYLPEGVRAWRLEQGVYRPWHPEADGRWHSQEISVALGLEGLLATVYTHAGQRILREGEVGPELAQRDAALEQERQLRARDQAELERLRRLLNER